MVGKILSCFLLKKIFHGYQNICTFLSAIKNSIPPVVIVFNIFPGHRSVKVGEEKSLLPLTAFL
jgi:hypothetical protein